MINEPGRLKCADYVARKILESDITVAKDGIEVNGKSVMGMMMLAAECGSLLKVAIKGKDEEQALRALRQLFDNKFNED